MADKNAEVAVEGNGGMKKTLSLWNFFTIGFGAIIGTGKRRRPGWYRA